MARKPLSGTVAENVLEHGTGAINVDGCRVNPGEPVPGGGGGERSARSSGILGEARPGNLTQPHTSGRWPANLIHDGSDDVVGLFPETKSGTGGQPQTAQRRGTSGLVGLSSSGTKVGHGDCGSAARFFYCAKSSRADRGDDNHHPTVKPTALMRYLVRLVTPPGGVVLDPFMGSGSTGKACALEGFAFIGIEREAEYVEIARARIAAVSPEPVTSVAPARHAPAPKPAPAGQLSLFDEVQT